MADKERWTVWAYHAKVKRWCAIESGLSGAEAVDSMARRADRVRRTNEPCSFKVLPEGVPPPPRAYARGG